MKTAFVAGAAGPNGLLRSHFEFQTPFNWSTVAASHRSRLRGCKRYAFRFSSGARPPSEGRDSSRKTWRKRARAVGVCSSGMDVSHIWTNKRAYISSSDGANAVAQQAATRTSPRHSVVVGLRRRERRGIFVFGANRCRRRIGLLVLSQL